MKRNRLQGVGSSTPHRPPPRAVTATPSAAREPSQLRPLQLGAPHSSFSTCRLTEHASQTGFGMLYLLGAKAGRLLAARIAPSLPLRERPSRPLSRANDGCVVWMVQGNTSTTRRRTGCTTTTRRRWRRCGWAWPPPPPSEARTAARTASRTAESARPWGHARRPAASCPRARRAVREATPTSHPCWRCLAGCVCVRCHRVHS